MATKMRTEFQQCRTYGHAWDEGFAPIDPPARHGSYRLSLRCIRCMCERYDDYNNVGALIYRKYRHAEGYINRKDDDAPSREQIRLWLLKRTPKQRRAKASTN